MSWFRRRRDKDEANRMADLAEEVAHDLATAGPVPSNVPRFWLDHGFEDGDRVECAVCRTGLEVRLVSRSPVAVVLVDAYAGHPLICGDCGRLLCLDCALTLHPNRPSCDRCRRIGGVTGLMR